MRPPKLNSVLSLAAILLLSAAAAQGAFLRNFPQTLVQPNGEILRCFAGGDEFYSRLHDAAGYTIIQDPFTGYYVYAVRTASGEPAASGFIAGRADPAALGLEKDIRHPPDLIRRSRDRILRIQEVEAVPAAPKTGTINNIVIFIRFSGESEFADPISTYSQMFNNAATGANSLLNYFKEASYNALSITATFYPMPGTTVVSFQDSQPRGYYQPYNAATNPAGYQGGNDGTERRDREHSLLRNAVNAVAAQVPAGLNLDGDGDGRVDNVCFIISGSPTGWASLLWPHMWSLYSQTAYLNGKRVYAYNVQLQTALQWSGVGVLCHEMFHTLGAPDLYHYSGDGLDPAGPWDIMDDNLNPPQHMGAYMKSRYGTWIGAIPEILTAGTYTLHPLTSAIQNCYKIASPFSSTEYFVVEYRRRTGGFESSLPGEGLIVTRIDKNRNGMGNADGPPDEVYVYRPNGTLTANGTENSAPLSSATGRTAINDTTNPTSFLSAGNPGGLNISNIGAAGETISFTVSFTPVAPATITLNRTKLVFGTAGGSPTTPAQTVGIGNSGAGTLNWTTSASQGWLAVSPAAGSGSGSIAVSADPRGLTAGTYSGSVIVSAAGASNTPQSISVTLNVYASGGGASPFGVIDTPADGLTGIEGSLPVTGWAVDDIEVAGVKIYRDPAGGEPGGPNGLVYIGDAVFVEGARPDIEPAFPTYPLTFKAGWGYMMLTNFLPNQGNGTFRLTAVATDKEGKSSLLGSKTITCDNAHAALPFGAIDTPSQGGTASGSSYINFAWVLASKPKLIPTDGSTITAWVDGLPLGHPSYGYYRADIAQLFPGYANANGAIGYIFLDTTKYVNGVHTIVWSATDSAGVNNGFGSRYFTIQNSVTSAASPNNEKSPPTPLLKRGERGDFHGRLKESLIDLSRIERGDRAPVYVRRGFDPDRPSETIIPGKDGVTKIDIRVLERVAVYLQAGESLQNPPPSPFRKGERYAAFLAVGDELRPLPIGSTFDSERGILCWQPGPGFLGEFRFVFVDNISSCKRYIVINIGSKFGK